MKIIVHNNDNLNESEITEKIYRARGVIINSSDEILLGYCKNTYQFPGGYSEENETIVDCLKREIKEETGIDIKGNEYKPFYIIKYYTKDWPEKGINRYTEFNYFLIMTDEHYDLNKTSFDVVEKEYNYQLRYVKLNEFEKILSESLEDNPKNKKVYPEMLDVIKTYYEEKQ